MDEQTERRWRHKAVRLHLRGLPSRLILRQIPRSRRWLYKWLRRFYRRGWPGLRSQSRRPHRLAHAYPPTTRAVVLRARRVLEQRPIGLIGPRAIQTELRSWSLPTPLPSLATIKRILHHARCRQRTPPPAARYYPWPTATAHYVVQAMDWTARYLPGGSKVYAFHSIDVQSRAIKQTIGADKRIATVRRHLLAVWTSLGRPDGLQMDNDAAFCGGTKVRRVFGQIVRLCLYLGIEPIFIPVGEAQRNGLVEQLNGLWSHSFWRRQHFATLAEVAAASPAFEAWYMQQYEPPGLAGQTPAQAYRARPLARLTAQQVRQLPQDLPITAGRLHFIRLVDPDGRIRLLNEWWRVGKRWAGRYVWATISTHRRQLRIYYRAAARAPLRLLKSWAYPLGEAVAPLAPEYRRPYQRRRMSTML